MKFLISNPVTWNWGGGSHCCSPLDRFSNVISSWSRGNKVSAAFFAALVSISFPAMAQQTPSPVCDMRYFPTELPVSWIRESSVAEGCKIEIHVENFTFETTYESTETGPLQGPRGIHGWRKLATGTGVDGVTGDVKIYVEGSTITITDKSGINSAGIRAEHEATGIIDIDVKNSVIDVEGEQGAGIYSTRRGVGNIDIDVQNTDIVTNGRMGQGVAGFHNGQGNVRINIVGGMIETKGEQSIAAFGSYQRGLVEGTHYSGDIVINVDDAVIKTSGTRSHGILGYLIGLDLEHQTDSSKNITVEGDILISITGKTSVSTTGSRSSGIFAANQSGNGMMTVTVGADATVSSSKSYGIQVGSLSQQGIPSNVAELDEDGFRNQTVTVNGQVSGNTGGVFMAGGGKLFVGPQGSIEAASGAAIRAGGTTEEHRAKLAISVNLNGRSVNDVLGNGRIENDGETTVTVNGVELTGETTTPNGVWDTRVLREGSNGLRIADFFAPRSAVYEALPSFLMRLDRPNHSLNESFGAGSADGPMWGSVQTSFGKVDPETSTVGISYKFNRNKLDVGWSAGLGDSLTGSFGLRLVTGSSDISAATGGGQMKALGHGLVAGLDWQGNNGYFGVVRVTATRYGIDFVSSKRGALASANAAVVAFRAESGRRFARSDGMDLTVRAWLDSSKATMESLTDTVGTSLSIFHGSRTVAGIGVSGRFEIEPEGWSINGFAGVEQRLSGQTAVAVANRTLTSSDSRTRFLLGLGAEYRIGSSVIAARIASDGLGSGGYGISSELKLRVHF